MIRTILVDDEANAIKILDYTIKNSCPEIEIIDTCNNIEIAYNSITKNKPDLVFLDIDLGKNTSFELLDLLKPFSFKVIFVTAHNDYAIKAFKYAAIDYILKPITSVDLIQAVQKLPQNLTSENNLNVLTEHLSKDKFSSKIALNTGKTIEIVNIDQIIYFQADEHYTLCYLNDGKKFHVNKSIKEFDEILTPKNFYRIHKSFLIHLDYIKTIDSKEQAEVVMKNDTKLPIAHKRKKEFFDFINNILPS